MEVNTAYDEWLRDLVMSRIELTTEGIPEYLKKYHYVGCIILNHMIKDTEITIDIGRDYDYIIDVGHYIELNSASDDRLLINEDTEDIRSYEDLLELLKIVGSVNNINWEMVYRVVKEPFEYPIEWRGDV